LLAHKGRHGVQEGHRARKKSETHREDHTAAHKEQPTLFRHIKEEKLSVDEIESGCYQLDDDDTIGHLIRVDLLAQGQQLMDSNQNGHLPQPREQTRVNVLASILTVQVYCDEVGRVLGLLLLHLASLLRLLPFGHLYVVSGVLVRPLEVFSNHGDYW